MRRVVMWVAGGAGLLGGVAALAEEAPAHAYSSEAVMTTITRRQLAVETLLPVVGTRPAAGATCSAGTPIPSGCWSSASPSGC